MASLIFNSSSLLDWYETVVRVRRVLLPSLSVMVATNGVFEVGFRSAFLETIDEGVDVAFGSFRHVKVLRVGIIRFLVLAL